MGSAERFLQELGDYSDREAMFLGYFAAPRPVATGIPKLDKSLGGGLFPGVTVLIGEPGTGKTAFAVQALSSVASSRRAYYFTLEVPRYTIRARAASWLSTQGKGLEPVPWANRASYAREFWGNINWERACESEGHAQRLNEFFHGRKPSYEELFGIGKDVNAYGWSPTVLGWAVDLMLALGDPIARADLQANLSVLNKTDGDTGLVPIDGVGDVSDIVQSVWEGARISRKLTPPLFAVDYLQYVQCAELPPGANETDRTQEISNQLTACAHDCNVPVLCISAKRKGASDGSQTGVDLIRGSSSIAYNAECVMSLTLDRERDEDTQPGWKAVRISVLKNRNGPSGSDVPLWFNGEFNLFSDDDPCPATMRRSAMLGGGALGW